MSYSKVVRGFNRRVSVAARDALRDGMTEMMTTVIDGTPVGEEDDPGKLKNNWRATYTPNSTREYASDVSGQGAKTRVAARIQNIDIHRTVYFSNPMDYAVTVELGLYRGVGPRTVKTSKGIFSTQAPNGMVNRNINQWSTILKKSAKKHARRV